MSPLVLCSLISIVTLIVSGIGKAKDPASTAAAIVNLKIDSWLPMKLVSKTLPWAELALAAWLLLLPGILGLLGGFAAVLLFAFYWIVIARAVFTGNTASCNCFGSASQAPVSEYTLGRNTALFGAAMGALIASAQTGRSVLGMLLQLDGDDWLWLLGAGFLALALWSVYRSELLTSPATDTEPALAQEFAGSGQDNLEEDDDYVRLPIPFGTLKVRASGQEQSLRELASSQARVLFWVSPGCGSCRQVIEKLDDWQEKLPMLKINPVVSSEESAKQLEVSGAVEILLDESYRTEPVFGRGTPLAVALGMDGLVAGGPVLGGGSVLEFMEDLLAEFEIEE